jgi:hypothetical protein
MLFPWKPVAPLLKSVPFVGWLCKYSQFNVTQIRVRKEGKRHTVKREKEEIVL